MKKSILFLSFLFFMACSHREKVLYETLTPGEFKKRIEKCPIAYLPLGTLEWHGEQLPLGSDGVQSEEFFIRLAQETGGIVLPKLFLGPDFRDTIINGKELYGMDCGNFVPGSKYSYPPQQLTGSAYYVPDSIFGEMINHIMKQLSRAGFKIVVAHGHGPSTMYVAKHVQEYKEKFNLVVMNCWGNDSDKLCLMCDHAAANETSIVMHFHPEWVQMDNLSKDSSIWPLGVGGRDPRIYASKKFGKEIVNFEVKKMKAVLNNELAKLQ